MKALLVAEYRNGDVINGYNELVDFAQQANLMHSMFITGSDRKLPVYKGVLYLADAGRYQEYNPEVHTQLIIEAANRAEADMVVFLHSSHGWDLAPRVAHTLGAGQISEVVEVNSREFVVPFCNGKLRRRLKPGTEKCVITIQPGAFSADQQEDSLPIVEEIAIDTESSVEFLGYEEAEMGGVDLGKAEIIVSAGRGVGKPENVAMIQELAMSLGGELGASRPIVDSEWVEHSRQVGTTGQSVAPKVYIACGISGAIQHLAGMKQSEFIIGINTDKDAPLSEIADVMVIADLKQFVPALIEKIKVQ